MTSKYEGHTRGPWIQQQYGKPCNPYIVAVTRDPSYGTQPRTTVARGNPTGGQGWPAIGEGGISHREAEANARLIAAAPDLLDACRTMLEQLQAEDLTSCDHEAGICNCGLRIAAKQAEAAIARAALALCDESEGE